mmetsp:Transcript_32782/g.70441  ORF Transcript_32782/g.70441 Transcript_32782/m.70441 type:complete len:201 (-) Transcript_32782:63-665(-)
MPIGIMQAAARSFLGISELILLVSDCPIAYSDILSTPPASPISIVPALMPAATFATACNPELHCRLIAMAGTSTGKSARNMDIRVEPAPDPGWRQLPICTSPIFLGSTLVLSKTALKSGASKSSGAESLKPPFLALAIAVRRAQQTTTSSSSGALLDMLAEVGSAAINRATAELAAVVSSEAATWLTILLTRCMILVDPG